MSVPRNDDGGVAGSPGRFRGRAGNGFAVLWETGHLIHLYYSPVPLGDSVAAGAAVSADAFFAHAMPVLLNEMA